MEEEPIEQLYRSALWFEYMLPGLREQVKEDPDNKGVKIVVQNIEKRIVSLEERIGKHSDRPRTPEEELKLKRRVIKNRIEFYQIEGGKCDGCANYLLNKINHEAAEEAFGHEQPKPSHRQYPRWEDVPDDGVVCDITGLQKQDPTVLFCPDYKEDPGLHGIDTVRDYQEELDGWLHIQKKYASAPSAEQVPRRLRL